MSFLKPPENGQRPGKQAKTEKAQRKDDPKRKYEEERRERKFVEEWRVEFPWLEQENTGDCAILLCTVCREFPSIADRTASLFTGSQSFRHSSIAQHLQCPSKRKRRPACQSGQAAKKGAVVVLELSDEEAEDEF